MADVSMWAALFAVALGGCASSPPVCDSYCAYQRDVLEKCEAGDGAACFARRNLPLVDSEAITKKACSLGHAPACVQAGDDVADLFRPHEHGAEAIALYRQGCVGGDAKGCVRGARVLLATGRASEVRSLAGVGCDAGDGASCRELARSLVFGLGGDAEVNRGLELLGSACERGDSAACALGAFARLSGHAGPRDVAGAHTLLTKSCDAGLGRSCAVRESLEKQGAHQSVAIVLSKSPVELALAAPLTAPLHAHATLSVIGPFEGGSVELGAFGVAHGAVRTSSPGALSFHYEQMSIIQMAWVVGDLVLIDWDAPREALTPTQCEDDYACRHDGFCTPNDGYCVRASAADCARTESCAEIGWCSWSDGRCVKGE